MAPQIHTMLDLETLGTRPGCVVLSIGACRFCPESGEIYADLGAPIGAPFYTTVDMRTSFKAGLTFEVDTLIWWMNQSQEARRDTFKGETSLVGALHAFSNWYLTHKGPIWCHGATFDVPILAAAYYKTGIDLPWDFRTVRDTRTLFDLAGGISIPRTEGVLHNALDDAINQAKAVCAAYAALHSVFTIAAVHGGHHIATGEPDLIK